MALKYKKMVVGSTATNCYIVYDNLTQEAVIIDPGDEGTEIAQEINYLRIIPKFIVLTHGHSDHWKGALELKMIFNIPIAMSRADKFLFKGDIDIDLKVQGVISSLVIIRTPGHTPGSICLVDKSNRWVFTGDIIAADGMEYSENYSYSNREQAEVSRNKILQMGDDWLILPGHGEELRAGSI